MRYLVSLAFRVTVRADCKDIPDERFVVEDYSSRNEDFKVLAFEVLRRESYLGLSFLDARQLNNFR